MRVSVVVCTHAPEMYKHFLEAAESVLDQTHDDVELIVVVDGSASVHDNVQQDYSDQDDVVVHFNNENRGLLESRNTGARLATGTVVAFIDDDAVADEQWLERLVAAYEEHDVRAAGGKMVPRWVAGRPDFLPEECYWLVGVTHRGFADGEGEVRNTFGSNISFDRETFLELGGFSADIGGRKGDEHLQGGETELCARLRERTGRGVWYVPEAEVEHKIFDYRMDPKWLYRRAFWQGYSKRGMEKFVPQSTGEEGAFLAQLLTEFVPERVGRLLSDPRLDEATQLANLIGLTGAVGAGYAYGVVKWR